MSLVTSLCDEMGLAPEALGRMVGFPADAVERWGAAGVPLSVQGDFRLLEDLVERVRERSPLPVRGALRVALPALEGRTLLEVLERHGPLEALRLASAATSLDPVWARAA